jgi:hypothetical protein
VCLASVQVREGHPNLGKESQVTASVAATFYNLYNFRGLEGGRPGREEAERGGRKPQKGEEIDMPTGFDFALRSCDFALH